MNFFKMKEIVDAAQKKSEEQKNAIEKKQFALPAVGASDDASAEAPKKKKTKKTEPQIPEGNEAENVIPEETPDDEDEEE